MLIARLQALLRGAFMRVEALFNRAFGDRLNPFYQLGAIGFFLFWVVCGSGLYLYAFFETGVADAYASVEALTQRQWFAGGLLRSMHRYASDAMVLTMALHALRHFAFDRLRGWRWFSWVTGVALVWLVYVAGVNGYMLPWDRLAQFVTVAGFEWLDALPGFGGTLMRNFIDASKVSDRFFSLLAFMHIGIPLATLLLLWVHVQRVPKAATAPARAIRFGLLASLLALALAWPVLSQGGAADLASAPQSLRLDWFFLLVFPLLYVWPPALLWAAAGAGTALLAALPWLPPLRAPRCEFRVTLHAAGGAERGWVVRAGETLLDAGLRQGIALPYECRNGGCGVCACSVLGGEVDAGSYQAAALPPERRARGEVLMCCATAKSDVAIEIAGTLDGSAAPRQWTARVGALDRLAPEVMRVGLELPEPIVYAAGQYLNVVLDDGQRRAFSFAAAPPVDPSGNVELHVRRIPGGRFTGHVFESLRVGDALRVEGPLGGFTLREGTRPIVFVAGATGFAPVKSLVEDAWRRGIARPMFLYWGVRRRADLYLDDLAARWSREHPGFRYVPVLSEPAPEDRWEGRTGLVHEALLADFPLLGEHEVYVCGSARMVETAVPAFVAHGLSEDACFSDAFLPARATRAA